LLAEIELPSGDAEIEEPVGLLVQPGARRRVREVDAGAESLPPEVGLAVIDKKSLLLSLDEFRRIERVAVAARLDVERRRDTPSAACGAADRDRAADRSARRRPR
jgi:hypothetical protein